MVVLGYNTPFHNPPAPEHDRLSYFHNQIVMQSAAYQNGTWIVAVAKAGEEEGCDLIGGTCIIAPTGEIAAQGVTLGDELITMRADLDLGTSFKETIFNFELHRQPEQYRLIVEQKGIKRPNA
jgi:predicted amidohydrolase